MRDWDWNDAPLFASGDLRDYLESQLRNAIAQVPLQPVDEVRFTPDAVIERLVTEHWVAPVDLHFDQIARTEPREAKLTERIHGDEITRDGHTLSIVVPITGDAELLRRDPSTISAGVKPDGFVRGDALVFSVRGVDLTRIRVDAIIEAFRVELTTRVGWANDDVRQWHPQLRNGVQAAVMARKRSLDAAATLHSELDIPLVRTDDNRRIDVPVTRQRVRLTDVTAKGSAPADPALGDAIYDDIVRTLCSLGRAVERLPRTSSRFNEVELRDLALFLLNSNYEGAARGEVFNGNGKTDLLLPWRDGNALVGECKVWRSPKKFHEGIDQLLGNVVWRDTKAVMLLFIRTGQPSEIIAKADAVIRAHPNFRTAATSTEPDVRRDYLMRALSDPQRGIRLAFLPVVIPAAPPQ